MDGQDGDGCGNNMRHSAYHMVPYLVQAKLALSLERGEADYYLGWWAAADRPTDALQLLPATKFNLKGKDFLRPCLHGKDT